MTAAGGTKQDEAAGPGSPRVSVMMIFLDGAEFLPEAIASLFAQDFTDWELVMVDDGSSDGSTGIARRLAEQYPDRVHCFEHPGHVNRGTSASRNLALRHSRGEYLIRLDCDDVFASETALGEQVALLDAHPDAGLVCGPCQYWNSWRGGSDHLQPMEQPDGLAPPPGLLPAMLVNGDNEPISMMARTAAIVACGGWEEEVRDFGEDFILAAKLLLRHRVLVTRQCWYRYRAHPGSYSHSVRAQGLTRRRERELYEWTARWLEHEGVRDPSIRRALASRASAVADRRFRQAWQRFTRLCLWAGWGLRAAFNRMLRRSRGQPVGRIHIDPRSADLPDQWATCSATVHWSLRSPTRIQVRVGAPDGAVFVHAAERSGQADTNDWVMRDMLFFLQDADAPVPGAAAATIDIVRARARVYG